MARVTALINSTTFGASCSALVIFFTCFYIRGLFLAESSNRPKCVCDRLCLRCSIQHYNVSIKALPEQFHAPGRAGDGNINGIGNQKQHFKKRLPKSLIIGVKKGGSKALLVFLGAHPRIKACRREVHFFDEERHYHRGLKWYRSQMPKSYSGEITIEKSPRYFISSRTPERVYRMSPDMKIILILRDPVKRAISDYVHMKIRRQHSVDANIESMLWNNETGRFNSNASFMQVGLYSVYLKNWLRYFPREQIHIVNGDNLIRDPGAELVKVQRFLNIDVLINRNDFVFHSIKRFYCLKNKPGLNAPTNKAIICLGPNKGRKHPEISLKTHLAMKKFYRRYNEDLYKLIGRDFGW